MIFMAGPFEVFLFRRMFLTILLKPILCAGAISTFSYFAGLRNLCASEESAGDFVGQAGRVGAAEMREILMASLQDFEHLRATCILNSPESRR
ncbi:MAG: hypothetical protein PHW43_00230, partial [Syntrophales bacterium]|nr:hypothetical protein [Syntrophales bacterium]